MPDTELTQSPPLADRIEAVIRLVREELSSGADSITLADYEKLIELREALAALIADVYAGAIYKAD